VDSTGESGSMLDAVCWLSSAMAAGDGSSTKSPLSPSKTRLGLAAEGVSKQKRPALAKKCQDLPGSFVLPGSVCLTPPRSSRVGGSSASLSSSLDISIVAGGDLTAPRDPETRASFLGEVLGLCEAAGQEAAFPALVDSQPRAARGL
jgi:hypothetical protein